MKIEKTIEENHEAKLVVEIEPQMMDSYKRKAARKISERGKIAGFRPGKAPYEVVVRNYGEQAVLEKAVDFLIDAEYSNILKEADVNPGAAGSLESIDSLEPPKLTFRVPLAPEADLGDLHAIRMPYEWTAPGEEEVDKTIENLRQTFSTTENVERAAQEGDYVQADVKSETTELNRNDFPAFISKEVRDIEWPYNGFTRELIGLKPGDTKTIQHTFPEDWELDELRGKDTEMEVTVKTVRGVTVPELDDEFARTVGVGETLDELRAAVRKDVEARSRADYDDQYFVDLIEKIKEGATLRYHQHALEHEAEHVLDELSQRLSQQNMDLETYFKLRNTTREKFLEEEAMPVARKRFERSLILEEVIRSEKIEVDNETLDVEFNQTLTALTMQGVDLNKIKGGRQGQQRVAKAVAMESANRVLTRKALEVLKSIATGEYVPPEQRGSQQNAEETVEEQPVVVEAFPSEVVNPNEEAPSESERLLDPSNEAESRPE